MKNLKSPERRLISSLLIATFAIVFCSGLYIYLINRPIPEIEDHSWRYLEIIDSLNSVVEKSQYTIDSLSYKVDSLENRKTVIINNYNEKVNIIRDASAAEHARWLESIVRELKDYKGSK